MVKIFEMVTKDTLKQWFKNGKKPDESQFWAWMDSYWHKGEKIPIDVIQDINNILLNKADIVMVNSLIKELATKADKKIVENLERYVYGLIDDSLTSAADKTYSIDKINDITKGFITEAVADLEYDDKNGKLIIEYIKDEPKEIILGKVNYENIINDNLDSGKKNTYSIDKIKSLLNNTDTKNLIIENSSTEALNYEQLENLYPNFNAGDVVLCINAGFKYEKTKDGWIEYNIRKLLPSKQTFLGPLLFSNVTSNNLDEIYRKSKILITETDKPNLRFKCNLEKIDIIKTKGTNGQPWFIAQGNEASSLCEIIKIDDDGWIYYDKDSLGGTMNINVGVAVEFFNSFTNYEILNNESPTLATNRSNTNLFSGYPSSLNNKSFKYLITGGILKKKNDNKYKIFIGAVGTGETFVAEDNNINDKFSIISQTPFFDGIGYPENRSKGAETLMWGITPVEKGFLTNHSDTQYIGLLGVKDGNISNLYKANYPGFILLDENGEIVKNEKIREANLINAYLSTKSFSTGWHITGLALNNSNWHLIVKNWDKSKMLREAWHIIIDSKSPKDLIEILEGNDLSNIKKGYLLHRGDDYIGNSKCIFYGQSDFNLFTYKGKLYCFYFFEPKELGYVNSMNRMCGIAKWDEKLEVWDYQNGLQLINPIQMFRKYPHLYWCFDHWGNLCCPYFESEEFYIATYLGTDNPDYFPAILKMNLNQLINNAK